MTQVLFGVDDDDFFGEGLCHGKLECVVRGVDVVTFPGVACLQGTQKLCDGDAVVEEADVLHCLLFCSEWSDDVISLAKLPQGSQ